MEWRGEGVALSIRRHGETSVIMDVLTPDRGRWRGYVRGGASKRMAPHLQPGNLLSLRWRSRIEDQMGHFEAEPLRSRAADAMADPEALAALGAFCALCCAYLPDREPAPEIYTAGAEFLDALRDAPRRRAAYARWELILLAELGFGLDLARCAATGATEALAYVSPRSGRAVSLAAGEAWKDKLLALPEFLRTGGDHAGGGDFFAALTLTGFFLERWASGPLRKSAAPEARARLMSYAARAVNPVLPQ